ncbi:GNAT family N-acetyltransferase [Streptosporangiaceae bacterium NEAU-GS5]|nr:GNAT family N-acetyltransferase [Streptosporangiaceae bacterium NEAU-GS5]
MEVLRAVPPDAGEILTVQRAAYVSEAQLYGDPFIPPLVESLDQMRRAIEASTVLKAVLDGRIVGAVRAQMSEKACLVGRLVVAPDLQGRGIGTALLTAVHEEIPRRFPEIGAFDLFTGHLSEGNLRLYRRHGYRETRRDRALDHLTIVHLRRSR